MVPRQDCQGISWFLVRTVEASRGSSSGLSRHLVVPRQDCRGISWFLSGTVSLVLLQTQHLLVMLSLVVDLLALCNIFVDFFCFKLLLFTEFIFYVLLAILNFKY